MAERPRTRASGRTLLAVALAGSCAWLACAPVPDTARPQRDAARTPPARPARCESVPPGDALRDRLARAEPGSALCLEAGEHRGPLQIATAVTLFGPREARVVSSGRGSTITVQGAAAQLLGFTVDGSGARYDREDAAVVVRASDGARIEGLHIVRATFGIIVHQSRGVHLVGNAILGNAASTRGLRGDAIRLWEVRGSTVADNRVQDSRDIVIWYSPGNRVTGNVVQRSRYGTHLMYSDDNVVERNVYRGNLVGIFAMYSRNVVVRDNDLLDSSEPGGMGLGTKEGGGLVLRGNRFVHDTHGLYLDTTPLDLEHVDYIQNNLFSLNQTAIVFHGRAAGNVLTGNVLRGNRAQVAVEGRGDALDAQWRGNHFDDYAGYDLDGDGRGDVPYALESLSGELIGKQPQLAFLRGTPALAAVEVIGRLIPLLSPLRVLVDESPRMQPGRLRTGA